MKNFYTLLLSFFLLSNLVFGQTASDPKIVTSDSVICQGSQVILSVNNGSFDSYSWSTGESTSSITVNPVFTTKYSVTLTSNGETFQDSIEITVSQVYAGMISGANQVCKVNTGTTLNLIESMGDISWQKSMNIESGSPNWVTIEDENNTSLSTGEITQKVAYRSIATNGFCSDTSAYWVISKTAIAGSITGPSKVCSNNVGTLLSLSESFGAIQWQKSTNSGSTWVNLTGATSSFFNTGALTATTSPVSVSYRAVLSANSCPNDYSNVLDITINPAAVAGTASLNDASGLSVCKGGEKTFKVTGNIGGIQWQSSSTSSTSGFTNIVDALSTPYTDDSISNSKWYRALITNGECSVYTNTLLISVNQPTLAGYISGNDTVCLGGASTLSLNLSSGTIAWQKSTNWTAESPTWTNILPTGSYLLATGALTATTAFRAKLTSGVCATATTDNFVVSVNPLAVSGTISSVASVCTGGDITLTLSGYTGSKIQWQSALTASGAFTDISGANSSTLTLNNVTSSSLLNYRAVITSGVCALKAITAVKTLVVNPLTVVGNVSGGGSVCLNAGGTMTLTGNNGGVQWQYSSDSVSFHNVPTASSDTVSLFNTTSSSGTASSYIVTSINSDLYFRALVKNGACSTIESNVRKFEIKENAIAGTISGNKDICVTGNTGTTLSLHDYQGAITWQKSTNWTAASPVWTSLTTTSSNLILGAQAVSTTAYRASVSIGSCSTVLSDTFILNVYPASIAGVLSANDANALLVCKGGNKALKITANVGSILWQSSINSSTSGFQTVDSTSGNLYTSTNILNPTWFKALVKSGTCPEVYTNIVNINVSQPTIAGIITGEDSLCSGASTTLNLNNYAGLISWQKSTNWTATTPTWTSITGTANLTTGPMTATTAFRALLSANPCPSSTTSNFILTVSPLAVAGTINSVSSICTGDNVSLTLSGYTGTEIQWQSSLTPTGAYANIPGATSTSLSLSSLTTTSNSNFKVVVKSGVCATKANTTVKSITIYPLSIAGTVSGGGLICPNTGGQLSLTGSRGSIQWQSSTDDGSTWSNISGASSTNYSASNLTQSTQYRAVVKNGSCPTMYSNSKLFTVKSSATSGVISGNNQLCKVGTNSTTLKLTGSEGTIKWQKSTNWNTASPSWADITNATTTSLPTGVLTVSTAYRVLANIGSCSNVASQTYVVTVYPAAVSGVVSLVNATSGTSVCYGGSKALKVTSNTGTIQWQTSSNDGLTWSNYDIPTTNQNYTFTNLVATKSYRVAVKSGVCTATAYSNSVKLTVSPIPIAGVISADTSTLCSGGSTNLQLANYVGTITWQKSTNWTATTPTWTNLTGTTSTLSTGNLTASTAFRAMLTSSPCNSVVTSNYIVTVIPVAVAGNITASSNSVCSDGSTTLSLTGYTGSAIQWQSSATASGVYSNIDGATSSSLSLSNLTSSSNLNYKAVVKSGTCSSATASVKSITIDVPTVVGSISGGGVICSGAGGTLQLTGNTGAIQWQYSTDGTSYSNIPTSLTSLPFNTTSLNANSASYSVSNVTNSTYFRAMVKSGMCPSIATNVKQFTVSNSADAGTISGSNEVCLTGNTGVALTLSGSTGTITWQKSTNWTADSPTWSTVIGSSATLSTGTLATSTAYRASVTIGTCSTELSPAFAITVYSASVAGTISGTNALCLPNVGTTLSLSGNTGSVVWQSANVVNGVVGTFTSVPNQTSSTLATGSLLSNTVFKAVVTNGLCASKTTTNYTVSMISPVSGSISSTVTSLCVGSGTTLSLTGSSGTIAWQKSTNWNTETPVWSAVTGTSTSLSTGNLTTSTAYRTILSNTQCSSDTSSVYVINVSDVAVPSSISQNQTTPSGANSEIAICTNSTIKILTVNSGYIGTIQWQKSTDNSTWTDISGANGTSYTVSNPSTGINYFRVKFTLCAKNAYSTNNIVLYYTTCESAKAITNVEENVNPFDVLAYPNPFEDVIALQLTSQSDDIVSILIFDISGKILEKVSVMADDIETIQLGKYLSSGIYNVRVSQGIESKNLRIIKK